MTPSGLFGSGTAGTGTFFVLIPTYVDAIFVGVFVSCYVASRRGVARGSGWVPITYIRILLT